MNIHFFYVTCGELTTDATFGRLQRLAGYSNITIINNVYPMSKAFNEAILRLPSVGCTYYSIIDSDMLLFENAIVTIQDRIDYAEDVFCYTFPLFDSLLRTSIYGLKIYHSNIVTRSRCRYSNRIGTDVAFEQCLRRKGYRSICYSKTDEEATVGIHMLGDATPGMVFSKFSDRAAKNPETIDSHLCLFDCRLAESNDPLYAAAILGLLSPRQATCERHRRVEESDNARRYFDLLRDSCELIGLADEARAARNDGRSCSLLLGDGQRLNLGVRR